MRRWLPLALMAAIACAGCGPDGSAIYETAPFFDIEADLPPANIEAFVNASTRFAERRGYEIVVNYFGQDKFSVFMHDGRPASLNLMALNPRTRGEVVISAIARGSPTTEQIAAANSYVEAIRPHVRNLRAPTE